MKWILGMIWLAFLAYAWIWAPGKPVGSDPVFKELITLQSKEAWLMTVFSWLGIFPAIFACLLLKTPANERGSRVPVWPFVLLSFGLGAFALLPYFARSSPKRSRRGREHLHFGYRRSSIIGRIAGHKLTHGILLLLTVGTACYGFIQGHPAVYMEAFRQSSFVHIMTIDFVVLTLLSVIAIYRDAVFSRRSRIWALTGVVPLIGPLVYLVVDRRSAA
ncbi:hypothetical protein [Paenibacillus illinoisensis]|uniref:hypothetical protein n=1 Tax=Paenibacillus illinoisensis TaxID=59845 RepID=UPI000FD8947C|nr:hypothetical protein [Paenibacillus illinoisensis]